MLNKVFKTGKKILVGWIVFPFVVFGLAMKLVNDIFETFIGIFRK